MRRGAWLLLLASGIGCGATAEREPEVLFAQAHAQTTKGEYKEALQTYEKISPKGHDVYFNMGAAAFGAHEYGHALLCWRRAEKFPSWSERLKLINNISHVLVTLQQRPVADGLMGSCRYGWWWAKQVGWSLLASLPLLPMQLSFLVLWFIVAFVLAKRQKLTLFLGILLTVTWLAGSLLVVRFIMDRHTWGVVISKVATLRSGPGTDYPMIGSLPEGREVLIKVTDGNFIKVSAGRLMGWTERGDIPIV